MKVASQAVKLFNGSSQVVIAGHKSGRRQACEVIIRKRVQK